MLASLFYSRSEGRLRAGWRLSLLGVLYLAANTLFALPVWLLLQASRAEPNLALPALQGASLAATCLAVWLARRFVDRRSFASLGFQGGRQAGLDLLAGFVIAGLLMGLIYLVEYAAGWLQPSGAAWQDTPPLEIGLALAFMLSAFLAVGFEEELLFRGYLLQNLSQGLKPAWGAALSSLIFGAAHMANPNASLMGVLGVSLAGLFMVYACWRTRQLWLAIGIHIGWNFFEGPLLGFPVSGIGVFQLLRNQISGPVVCTGGGFGPEAGLVLLPGLALGVGLVYLYSRFVLESA